MAKTQGQSESVIARVSQELAALERRDWQLWLIVAGTGIVAGAAFLALLYPAAILHQGTVHLELIVSREAFVGLAALMILFNTYMITRRLELRRMREEVISTSIQNELVRLQSFTDPLTEVYNRRSLDDMAARFMARARRLGKPLTFLVADADNFKEVNTRFGHLTGDFVIAEIAAMLQGAVRGSDAVVRFGGDEFLVILSDAALAGATVAAQRLEKTVEEWNKAGHLAGFQLSLSIGLAEWSTGQTLDQVLTEADRQMYAAKEVHPQG
ncbi:MAG: GGDEF domain-containing protein [Acidobacteriia bacterium]|nr:GGDEF domain-containing protein [Terriglobia bacterium]